MKIDYIIMAHHSRSAYLKDLLWQLPQDKTTASIDQGTLGVWENAKRSWSKVDPKSDYGIVIQDDAILCDGFTKKAEQFLTEYASADEVANAILQQPKQSYTQPVQNSGDKMISDKQVKLINFKLYELKTSSLDDFDAYREWYKSLYGSKPVDKLTMSEAKLAIDKLMDMIIEPDYSDPTKYGTPDAKYDGGVTTDISEYSDETF